MASMKAGANRVSTRARISGTKVNKILVKKIGLAGMVSAVLMGIEGKIMNLGTIVQGRTVILKEIVQMVTGLISSVQMGSVLTSRDRKVSSIIFSGQILMDSVLAWVVKGPTWDICLKGQQCPKICVLVGKNL